MSSKDRINLLQGTLDLMVMRVLWTMGSLHAYAIASRLEQISKDALRLNQGTLYPALVRLEQKRWIRGVWRVTENNREAKYYSLTRPGQRALDEETARWHAVAGLVDKVLASES